MLFFNKSLVKQGVFNGYTDCHSHILYGVDDGVKTIEDSLTILKQYEEWGVEELWLTPHIQEYIPNETEKLKERYELLMKAYTGSIKVHLSAEYMIDTLFAERFENNDLLFHGTASEHLLVETSYFNPPIGFHDTLNAIMQKGIRPILAHPERYIYMDNDEYDWLHEIGIVFQLNLASLVGAYGETARKKARYLLKRKYYSMSGTDIHSPNMLRLFSDKRTESVNLQFT